MKAIDQLVAIMASLRDPKAGCPWDLRQDLNSLAPYTIEEAYEVIDAIERNDLQDLREELGDLLLQVVFQSQITKEAGVFDFEDVVDGISQKLVSRHPHVFSGTQFETDADRQAFWEDAKKVEKAKKGKETANDSLLGEIPTSLPGLMTAQKLQARAARHGFDWPNIEAVFSKLEEDIMELKEAISLGDSKHQFEELGDVMFVLANIARHLDMDAETSLRACNQKFIRRFSYIEDRVAESGQTMSEYSLEALDRWWVEAKYLEKGN